MIVNKKLAKSLFQECLRKPIKCHTANIHNRSLIGNRDWVGYGKNGAAVYQDDVAYPCPAIRFKENTNELFALREKEKGDWRKLSIEEKKILYRASFCQTLVEAGAPTGQWKEVVGVSLICISLGIWLSFCLRKFVYSELPPSYSEEGRAAMLRTMLDLKMGHLTGISSKWDYEKDDWK